MSGRERGRGRGRGRERGRARGRFRGRPRPGVAVRGRGLLPRLLSDSPRWPAGCACSLIDLVRRNQCTACLLACVRACLPACVCVCACEAWRTASGKRCHSKPIHASPSPPTPPPPPPAPPLGPRCPRAPAPPLPPASCRVTPSESPPRASHKRIRPCPAMSTYFYSFSSSASPTRQADSAMPGNRERVRGGQPVRAGPTPPGVKRLVTYLSRFEPGRHGLT